MLYDEAVHGPLGAVLPLLPAVQQHKPSTSVRPCLDYSMLNEFILSNPGANSPVCGDKIREWRQRTDDSKLLDIWKAYLQVHLDESLQRYQVVVWNGDVYVMTRMGFGLNIAPKVMDTIIQYVTQDFDSADNYVDDLHVSATEDEDVAQRLSEFGLPTKPAESIANARVLGLQLFVKDDQIHWRRRDDSSVRLDCEGPITKRDIFRWCGRLTSHYQVCSRLRPACSFLKRLECTETAWDAAVSPEITSCCAELQSCVEAADPVTGIYRACPRRSGLYFATAQTLQ